MAGVEVTQRGRGGHLSFAAPPLMQSGHVDPALVSTMVAGLRISAQDVLAAQWVDNGPGWVALQLSSADAVLRVEPDAHALDGLRIGLVGAYPDGAREQFEVRAFAYGRGVDEDPVTGSLNAGLGQRLIDSGRAPQTYVVRQGTRLGRYGRVHVTRISNETWVGGTTSTLINDRIDL